MEKLSPETFLAEHVRAKHRPTVEAFQALVAEQAPQIIERTRAATEDAPAALLYWNKTNIFTLVAEKSAVAITFAHGTQFLDPHGLLTGSGKTARVFKIARSEDFPTAELSLYVSEAVRVDELNV